MICRDQARYIVTLFLVGFFAMTEGSPVHHGKTHAKWVMCPTCRQHTDYGNIAFADDGQNRSDSSFHGRENSELGHENSEASITVHGSYGTKVPLPSKSSYNHI